MHLNLIKLTFRRCGLQPLYNTKICQLQVPDYFYCNLFIFSLHASLPKQLKFKPYFEGDYSIFVRIYQDQRKTRRNKCRWADNIVTWRLKVGIMEPEETFITRQRLVKHVPAATNTKSTRGYCCKRYFLFGPCKVVIELRFGIAAPVRRGDRIPPPWPCES
jgi:hypothetical protein